MQTKEEVLAELFPYDPIQRDKELIMNAMQEYANQQCIDFGRWLLKHANINLDNELSISWIMSIKGKSTLLDTNKIFEIYSE